MIFRHQFQHNLVRAELDTDGEPAILRLKVDALIRDKRQGEYALDENKGKDWTPYDSDEIGEGGVKADIEEGRKEALEWAKERMLKYRIKKKISIDFSED